MASIEKSMSDLDLKEIQIPSSDVSTKPPEPTSESITERKINEGDREELEMKKYVLVYRSYYVILRFCPCLNS